MGKLGISIYPEKTTEKEVTDYIDKQGKLDSAVYSAACCL